jgi:hypothetical protein
VHVEQSQWWASEKAMDGVTACERGAGAVQERVGCSSRQRRSDHRLRAGTSLVGNASGQKQAANGTSELYCVHYRAVEQWIASMSAHAAYTSWACHWQPG